MNTTSRRRWIRNGLAATAAASGAVAAATLAKQYGLIPPDNGGLWGPGATLTYASQRLVTRHSMAREFDRSQISNPPLVNGAPPGDEIFKRHLATGFADWRLAVDGMVARPGSFSVAELRSLPSSTQITHLACEEGWSYIAEWTGVALSRVLELAGILPGARFAVYFSIDKYWWDSVDMADALHPQTLVAYGMNGGDLPVGNGGPLRLRVPRQLGYKSVKYITRVTVTDDIRHFGKGLGSSAPEGGYSWNAGI